MNTRNSGTKSSSKNKFNIAPFILLLPLFSILIVFKYYSFAFSIYMSLFDWNGMSNRFFVGLSNYKNMFADDTFLLSMKNLLLVVVFNSLKMLIMSFFAAELVVNIKNKRAASFFKYMFIILLVVPTVVTTLLWKWIYDYKGLVNVFLELIGMGELVKPWLATEETALLSILFIGVPWVAGIPFLVMLSGIQSISESLYETARLEGCSYAKRLWFIDIPLLMGQIKYVLITTIISSVQFFEPIQILTGGGPGGASMTPAMHMYWQAFNFYKFGYSAAIGTCIFALVMVVTVINLKLLKSDISQD